MQFQWHGARVSGSITANGRTLLPKLEPGEPGEAVRYAAWALVDMREGDRVELTVQRESPLRSASYRVTSPGVAVAWLEETLGALVGDNEPSFAAGPVTVTRPKPREGEREEVAIPSDRQLRR